MPDSENRKIDFLKKVSDYFQSQTKEDGSIFCKKDRVEHTGKNCYSVIIDSKLFDLAKDEKYFIRAKKRAFRTISQLIKDPETGVSVFYPGRLDPRNASNSIIDGGACVDSLCAFFIQFEKQLSEEEKNKIKDAIYRHADEYLKQQVLLKPITNQRLWGVSGLASAYKIFKKDDWREAVLKAIDLSFSEQNSDGSFPYHPHYKDIGGHPGMGDITPYYHSPHIAFIIHSLEQIGVEAGAYFGNLKRGTDFLLAMYQPDGIKNILLEGKRWYWNSDYEIVSNLYDIYVFVKMFNLTQDKNYLIYAGRAYKQVLRHQLSDGGIDSCKNKKDDWQCRVLWNSHVAWLARIIEQVPADASSEAVEFYKNFSDAGVIKYENAKYSFILRYKKKPVNNDWGGLLGGGNLLYYGLAKDGWRNLAPLNRKIIKHGKNSLQQFLADNRMALKGERWRIFVYLTSGNAMGAIKRFYREVIKKYFGYGNEYSTAWETNAELLENNERRIVIKTFLARRDGTRLPNAEILLEHNMYNDRLETKESILKMPEALSKNILNSPPKAGQPRADIF